MFCVDVNECLTNNGGCEGLCINTPGSYRCHCPPGFMVADTKCEGKIIKHIDNNFCFKYSIIHLNRALTNKV